MSFVGWDACFPTIIGRYNRIDLLEDVQKVFDKTVQNNPNVGLNTNEYFHYITDDDFDVLPDFLKKEFAKNVIELLKEVCNIDNELKLTTSWFTKESAGSHHHVNSYYSAVFYLVDGAEIEFTQKQKAIYVESTEFSINSASSVVYTANKGDLLIFPSDVTHKALPYEGKRHSLAMNFMPTGKHGCFDSTYTYV